MNILVPTLGSSGWIAGVNYIVNLCKACAAADPEARIYHLGTIDHQLYNGNAPFSGEVHLDPQLRFSPGWLLEKVRNRCGIDLSWKPAGNANLGIVNVGFQIDDPRLEGFMPILKWIADFQHLHCPEFFTEKEIVSRNAWYRETARRATLVILSSENAKKDFVGCFPEYAAKARVLRFVADIPEEALLSGDGSVVERYHLPDRFFFLPNQFWKHKNHKIVFEALSILQREQIYANVVMTGHTYDYRYPKHFDELLNYIAGLGIGDRLFFLGMVSFPDLMSLQRMALALLNPSLFEGWSTSVEEAKSLGQRIILSDIEVHKEQAPEYGIYFENNNAESLAEAMKKVWCDPTVPSVLTPLVIEKNSERQREFGANFLAYCREAINLHCTRP